MHSRPRFLPRYRASLRRACGAAAVSALVLAGSGCGSSGNGSASAGGPAGSGGSAGQSGSGGAGNAGAAGTAGAVGGAGGATAACTPAATYPAGPYGENVGDTIADWHWKGYVNETAQGLANTHPYVNDYSMDDLRRSGRGYALVHLSENF